MRTTLRRLPKVAAWGLLTLALVGPVQAGTQRAANVDSTVRRGGAAEQMEKAWHRLQRRLAALGLKNDNGSGLDPSGQNPPPPPPSGSGG